MREIVLARRLPRRQLSVDRAARADHAARHQRVQPARDQRDPRQHLGQLLVRVVQDAAVGRHDQDPPSGHRHGDGLPAARRRPRLHPARVARQPLVDGAVPAEQHRRPVRMEPVGRGAHARRSSDRSSRCCGPSGATKDPLFAERERPRRRRDRSASPSTAISKCPKGTSPPPLRPLRRPRAAAVPVPRRRRRLGEGRPVPEGHADRPASRTSTCSATTCRRPSATSTGEKLIAPAEARHRAS